MTETVADETMEQPAQARVTESNGLKVSVEPLEACEVRLTIELAQERVEAALRQTARRLANQIRIPGFRKGKAPFDIMVRYIGREALLEEALEPLTKDVYEEALKLAGIEPFARGRVEDVRTGPPLTLEMIVPLAPVVDLGDYRALRMEAPKAEVSDEQMKEALQRLREQHAVLEPVDRPAQLGDLVNVTVRGRVDNRIVVRGDEVDVLLDPESDRPGPGFAQAMVGAVAGQERAFSLHYPDDWPNSDTAGKDVQFRVITHQIQSRYVPPLNDEFAQSLEDEHIQTQLDLRIRMRQQLQESLQRRAEANFGRQVLDQVIATARIEYPPILIERELDNLMEGVDRDIRAEQRMTLDDYLKTQGKTRAAYREELRPQAEQRLKRALALTEVVKQEGLQVSAEEVEKEIDRLSGPFDEETKDFRGFFSQPKQKRHLESDLLTDKAFERLVQIATGRAPEAGQPTVLVPGRGESTDRPAGTSTVLVP